MHKTKGNFLVTMVVWPPQIRQWVDITNSQYTLNCRVELRRRQRCVLCIEFATSSRRLPTGLVENLETEHVENLLPNTHRRRDATVELSRVGGVYAPAGSRGPVYNSAAIANGPRQPTQLNSTVELRRRRRWVLVLTVSSTYNPLIRFNWHVSAVLVLNRQWIKACITCNCKAIVHRAKDDFWRLGGRRHGPSGSLNPPMDIRRFQTANRLKWEELAVYSRLPYDMVSCSWRFSSEYRILLCGPLCSGAQSDRRKMRADTATECLP